MTPNPLTGSSLTEMWDSDQTLSGIVSATQTIVFAYYNEYHQTLSYRVIDGGSGYGAPAAFGGLQFGSVYSPTLTTTATGYWFDATGTLTFTNPLAGSGTSRQWVENSVSVPLTSSNSEAVLYYDQCEQTLSYEVIDGESGYSAPVTIGGLQYGSAYSATLSTSGAGYWFDAVGTLTFTNPLSGSGSTEQWVENSVSVPLTSSNTQVVLYYNQFRQTLSYSVVYGGTPTAPTASGQQYGSAYAPSLTASAMTYWFDANGIITINTPTNGANERWSPSPASVSATQSDTQVFDMYNQYQQTFSCSIAGGGLGYSEPSATGTQLGSAYTLYLTTTANASWFDATGAITLANPLPGSTATERWETQISLVSATQSNTQVVTYYNQYSFALSYSISGGGSPATPTLISTQFGASYAPTLTISATTYWLDSGQSWSVTNPLGGSNSTEQWAVQMASGTVSSSSPTTAGGSFVFTFYNQYGFILSYLITGGGSPTAPTLTSTQAGSVHTSALTGSPVTYWLDSSASWSLTNPLGGSGSSERWDTSQTVSGTVGGTVTTAFTYYNQYMYTLSYSIAYGGSGYLAPTLASTQFGGSYTLTLTTSGTGYWLDQSAACSVTNPLPGSGSSERWDAATACPTVNASRTVVFTYLHQYYFDSLSNSVLGGSIRNVTQWYSVGARVTLSATASGGWRFMFWRGTGSGSYNGTEPAPPIIVDGPANETAIFYAGLTLHPDPNGYLTYSFGSTSGNVSAGSEKTVYVPPGTNVTLKATPGNFAYVFAGWAGDAKGSAPETSLVILGPQSVSASYILDYGDISVVAIAIPLVVVISVYILAVRRWPRGQT